MIPVDLISKGFDFVTGKGTDFLKTIVGELDKHRLIDYGEQRVENRNFHELDRLCHGALITRRKAEQDLLEHGLPKTDKYRRS